MADALWKKAERKICGMLGGTRRGPTGRRDSDCYHPWLAVEIKNRKMPTYIRRWMSQAIVNREPDHLPIVVWHSPGTAYQGSLVILQLDDFRDWFGDGGLPFTDEPEGCNHAAHNWNKQEDGTWTCRGCGESLEIGEPQYTEGSELTDFRMGEVMREQDER